MHSIWRLMLLVIVLLVHFSYVQLSSIKFSETADESKPHVLPQVERRSKQAVKPGKGNGSENPGKGKQKGKYTKEEFEAENIDVDSELFDIIASMSVNGKPTKEASMIKLKRKFKNRQKEVINMGNGNGKGKNNRHKRNFIADTNLYWPGGVIPFTVNRSMFDDASISRIQEVLDEFHNKTCLNFINKTLEEIKTEGIDFFVRVTGHPTGCNSFMGRQVEYKGKGLNLNLERKPCTWRSIITHEFGHIIGMVHEQSRFDRDKHVTIIWENIQKSIRQFYGKGQTDDRNPYDYYSVLHYALYEFENKIWGQTMEFRDPELEFLHMGSHGLSFYDVMNIATAYNCSAKCTHPEGYCKNGGFLSRNCTCFCPESLTGPDCSSILTEFGNPHLMMLIFDAAAVSHFPGKGFKLTATAIDASISTDCGAPPVVPNSSNNHAKMGSKRGAIVRYKCDYGYGFGGIGSSVTCEADGTWSEVQFNCTLRDEIFGCDFKNGLCNIKLESNGTHDWTVSTQDGDSFLTVLPATIPTEKIFSTIILPPEVYNNQSYCLSFKFQRTSNNNACANFGWGNTFNKMVWKYNECERKTGEVITGTFKMAEQVTKVTFTSIAERTELNARIDFINLYKGAC